MMQAQTVHGDPLFELSLLLMEKCDFVDDDYDFNHLNYDYNDAHATLVIDGRSGQVKSSPLWGWSMRFREDGWWISGKEDDVLGRGLFRRK
jgi:hypothetical protein